MRYSSKILFLQAQLFFHMEIITSVRNKKLCDALMYDMRDTMAEKNLFAFLYNTI